jgi:type I restriction enzyme S subunit
MATNVEQNKKALSASLGNTEKTLEDFEKVVRVAGNELNLNGSKQLTVEGSYSHELKIPDSWVFSELKNVIEIVGGSQPPKSEFNSESGEGLIRLIQIRDYKSDKHIVYIPKEKARRFVSKTEIMIGRYGPPIFQILRGLEGAYNVALMKAIPVQECMTNEYLFYYLSGRNIYNYVESASDRTAGQSGVNKAHLEKYPVGLPPLAEQTIIAQTLDTLLAQVDNIKTRLDAIPKILKTFRQSVLAAAVSGKLTEEWRGENEDLDSRSLINQLRMKNKHKAKPYDPSSPLFELFESWGWCRLGDIYQLKSGTSLNVNIIKSEGDYPYFKVGDMNAPENKIYMNSAVNFADRGSVSEKSIIPKDAITFPKRGGAISTNKKRLIKKDSLIDLNTMAIISNGMNVMYTYYWFQTIDLATLNTGSTIPQVNNTDIEPLWVPVAPIKEQTQVVHRVEELFAFADQVEQQVKNAQGRVNNLTQSILAKAFRGELTTQWRADNPDLISGENSAAALLAEIKKEREELKPVKKSSAKKTIKKTVKKKAAVSEKKAPSEPLSQDSIASETQVESVTAKKPKAVVDLASATARQNKQQKARKVSANNSQAAPSIESPETDLQWWAFIRSHYKKSNPDLTLDELMAHLVQTLQIKRLSPQRKALLEQVIKKACKWQVLYKESGVYCLYEVQFADYDNEALDILLPKLLRKGSSIPQDDLYREYLQGLGFKRGSPKAEERFKNYLRSALRRKLLQREGNQLKRT